MEKEKTTPGGITKEEKNEPQQPTGERLATIANDIDGIYCDICYATEILMTMCQTLVDLLETPIQSSGELYVENYYLKQNTQTAAKYTHIIDDYIRSITTSNAEVAKAVDAIYTEKKKLKTA